MVIQKIKLRLGKPQNGWLPVQFKADNFEVSFEASDVPVDPIDQLCDALALALKGIDSEVWWHLEPAGYYFSFSSHDKILDLKIYSDVGQGSKRKLEYEINGNFEAILLPIYRGLKEFTSINNSEPHWPSISIEKSERLTKLIQHIKT